MNYEDDMQEEQMFPTVYEPELDSDAEDCPEAPEDNYSDAEADADTLASAGMGTDEDYNGGCFESEEF